MDNVDGEVRMVPIDQIRIVNPRPREKKRFELIMQSIRNLGLKKPIQVRVRAATEGDEPGFDLVCGQGRLEAFVSLGHREIPAVVVSVTRDEGLLRSLVENIARRQAQPQALMEEIERLKGLGYTNQEIGEKLDIATSSVGGYLALKHAGEERLLDAAVSGKVPLSVAMEIAKADSPEMQRELLKAYEGKQLNWSSIRVVKRIMDQRRFAGKRRDPNPHARKSRTSADSLVNAFKRESQRQKLLVKKARVCEAKLLFLVTAFKKLVADDNFVTLLRAEGVADMPKYLHEKLTEMAKEAA
jgi:ParB family transcriptional regulator, chromosome partitioning protein